MKLGTKVYIIMFDSFENPFLCLCKVVDSDVSTVTLDIKDDCGLPIIKPLIEVYTTEADAETALKMAKETKNRVDLVEGYQFLDLNPFELETMGIRETMPFEEEILNILDETVAERYTIRKEIEALEQRMKSNGTSEPL